MLPTSIAGSTSTVPPFGPGSPSRSSVTSTLAAKPGASAIASSPAAQGAMYSWAPEPPIIPTSDSTRYQRSPQRSRMRA